MDWPLVGRGGVLDRALRCLSEADGGVLFAGPMGVGKTRLLEHVAEMLAEDGWSVRRASASESTARVPFGAVSHLLPALPVHDLLRMFASIRQRLLDEARERPLLLVVDDAHHLDEYSAALVHRLCVDGGIRVGLTMRSSEPPRETLTTLWKDGHVERIEVQPLERDVHARLLEEMLEGPVGPDLEEQCWMQTNGNPLFLRELVLAGLDRGLLVRRDGRWRAEGDLVPSDRLVEIIESRLVRLDAEPRRVLEVVAVGEPLRQDLARGLLDVAALDELEDLRLVRSHMIDDVEYVSCAHPLHGETLRAAMSAHRRVSTQRDLAAAVAAADEIMPSEALQAATWLLAAGDTPDADLAEAAAREALARSDAALAERLSRSAVSREARPAALRTLGTALSVQGRVEDATAVFVDAYERSEQDADIAESALAWSRHLLWAMRAPDQAADVLARALGHVAGAGLQAELRAEQAIHAAVAGDAQRTIDIADDVTAMPEASDRAVLTALVQSTLARCMLGRFAGLPDDLRRGRQLAVEQSQTQPLALLQLEVTRLMYRHYIDLTEVREAADAGHATAVEAGRPAGLWSLVACWTRIDRGESGEAARIARRTIEELRQFDPFHNLASATGVLAVALGMLGDGAGARAALDSAGPVEFLEPRSSLWHRRGQAWILAAEGRFDEAAEAAATAGEQAIQASMVTWGASALYDAVRLGAPGRVVDLLSELARDRCVPLLDVFAAGAVAGANRDPHALESVCERFADVGALAPAADAASQAGILVAADDPARSARDAVRAAALRRACGVDTPVTAYPTESPLSQRQQEVAALAAAGHRSRHIADELHLSTRTVDNHLARIYRLLEVSGREDLARLMTTGVV